MNKTYQTELRRLFLIRDLPEPLVRSSSHLQIFDNYIENTRLRLRSMRSPDTKEWHYHLQQRFPLGDDFSHWKIAEIYLNEAEHALFEHFEGREIAKNERAETNEVRKNRYFYDLDGRQIDIDLFLGELWGLMLARVVFENEKDFEKFELPPFVIAEVTDNPFFSGENLVGKHFADIQAEFARMNETHQIILNEPDE